MNCCDPRWWTLALSALLTTAVLPARGAQHSDALALSPELAAEEKETCIRNLKVIYDAIQAYQFDHKDLPNWLSDLVPDYLTDGNVLICPACRRTGRTESPPLADPKLACSYIFEFCPVSVPGEPKHTRREWKRRQMGLIGSAVPLVRCRHHNPMLNLGFNGNIYESPPQWELLFTNRIRPIELSVQAIFGGDTTEEKTPTRVFSQARQSQVVAQDTSGNYHTVDLSRYFTSTLTEAWEGKTGDDLASLPKGLQSFGGIQFEVSGVVQLKGKATSLARFPSDVKGIPIGQHCQHLYFLHAACLDGHPEEGEQIGSYLVHLAHNEMTLEIPIFYGRSVRSWHKEPNEPEADKDLRVAWTGENGASKATGRPIRLFVTAWNLAPGVDVESLDFVSAKQTAAPFLLAISVD